MINIYVEIMFIMRYTMMKRFFDNQTLINCKANGEPTMWKKERKKAKAANIILALLCILIAVGLGYSVIKVREITNHEESLLQEEYGKQQAEQTVAREQSVEDIDEEYQKDLDTVSKYLPGIVCWGDTLTSGSSGTVSYPYILQKYIDTYICDIYDFRQSIDNANDFSRLDWDKYKVNIPVINMGVENEDSTTVLGRSGAMPFVLTQRLLIPASVEPVEVHFSSLSGRPVSPLRGGDVGVNPVSINDIQGTLTIDTDENLNTRYYFTRLESGEETLVQRGAPIVTSATDMYKNYLHVVCIGTYGGYDTANELVAQIKLLLSRQTDNTDRYLVLGICYQNEWKDMSALDSVMVQSFGEHYINIRKYLCSDGMADAGLSPTYEDKLNAESGLVPVSLRSAGGDAGLSAKAYMLIGKLVYERMEKLGYFDEVVNELYIDEVRRDLLKNYPDYFSKIINNW